MRWPLSEYFKIRRHMRPFSKSSSSSCRLMVFGKPPEVVCARRHECVCVCLHADAGRHLGRTECVVQKSTMLTSKIHRMSVHTPRPHVYRQLNRTCKTHKAIILRPEFNCCITARQLGIGLLKHLHLDVMRKPTALNEPLVASTMAYGKNPRKSHNT